MGYTKVLIWFSCHRDYFRFRIPELVSLLSLSGYTESEIHSNPELEQPLKSYENNANASKTKNTSYYDCLERGSRTSTALGYDEDVFIPLRLPSDTYETIAQKIMERSILVKGVFQLWASGDSYEEVISQLNPPPDALHMYINATKSFAFLIKSFGYRLSQEERIQRMSHFSFLFTKDVKADLQHPDTQLAVFEKWERATSGNDPVLYHVFFGRTVAIRPNGTPWWSKYQLTARPILGPTTLDTELSFIMANQAKVKPGVVVFDPFCGTGGLLIAAAHLGALTVGADIDTRVLKGWGVSRHNKSVQIAAEDTSIFQNFIHYGLEKPEIIRRDVSAWGRHEKIKPWVDIILTDPPYGVRASVRKVAAVVGPQHNAVNHRLPGHIPATCVTLASNVIRDLLDLASDILIDNGSLVFLLPVVVKSAREEVNAILGPDFKMEAVSLQSLSGGLGRALITLTRLPR